MTNFEKELMELLENDKHVKLYKNLEAKQMSNKSKEELTTLLKGKTLNSMEFRLNKDSDLEEICIEININTKVINLYFCTETGEIQTFGNFGHYENKLLAIMFIMGAYFAMNAGPFDKKVLTNLMSYKLE